MRCKYSMIFTALLAIPLNLLSASPVSAQKNLFEDLDVGWIMENQVHKFTLDQMYPDIRANKYSYIKIFSEIKVYIRDNPKPTAQAKFEDGIRSIEINNGIAFLVLLYAEYSLLRNYYPEYINDKCSNYIDFLAEVYKDPDRVRKIDYRSNELTAGKFCGAEKLMIERWDEYASNYRKLIDQDSLLRATIGFMLGHEYGHHLLGHLPPRQMIPSRFRKIEQEADYLASNMLGNYASRSGATLIFDFLEKRRQSDPFATDRRYPAEECRFIFLMEEDMRFWRGHQGYDLLVFLRQHIEIREKIPNILQFIEARRRDGKVFSRCDDNKQSKKNTNIDFNSQRENELSQCWEDHYRLNTRYEEVYVSIDSLKNQISDLEQRKIAACPKFKELDEILVKMGLASKKCSLPKSNLDDQKVVSELRSAFKKIIDKCI